MRSQPNSLKAVQVALLSTVAALVLAAPGTGAGAGAHLPSGAYFALSCPYSHGATDDPIVLPGLPNRSHDHAFLGNVSTNAYSTPSSLRRHGTSCTDLGDRSAYWAPMLYLDGRATPPLEATVYYRRLTTGAVNPYPPGLEMVAGNAHAIVPQHRAITFWFCGVLKSTFYGPLVRSTATVDRRERGRQGTAPVPLPAALPSCRAPTNLELQVNFPDCSNGKPDSIDHRRHMAYSRNGRCPASHPIAVPALSLVLRYPPVTGGPVFLSSGGVDSGHADFMDGWDEQRLRALIGRCLNAQQVCQKSA